MEYFKMPKEEEALVALLVVEVVVVVQGVLLLIASSQAPEAKSRYFVTIVPATVFIENEFDNDQQKEDRETILLDLQY